MFNRSLFYGEGVFETIKWRGETKKLRRHYERLKDSAEFFSIKCPPWEEFINEIKKRAGEEKDIYVKVCLFALGEDPFYEKSSSYMLSVVKRELPSVPDEVSITVSECRRHSRNPLVYHKTTSYLFNILVKRKAMENGFFDAVILNEKGEVTECSSSNIVILRGSRLYTPALDCGLLWGTTLATLYEKMDIAEERLRLPDLLRADAVYLTNSLMDVVPVTNIGGERRDYDKTLLEEMKHILNLENSVLGK